MVGGKVVYATTAAEFADRVPDRLKPARRGHRAGRAFAVAVGADLLGVLLADGRAADHRFHLVANAARYSAAHALTFRETRQAILLGIRAGSR
jgi:hypothetical protein